MSSQGTVVGVSVGTCCKSRNMAAVMYAHGVRSKNVSGNSPSSSGHLDSQGMT